MRMLSQSEVAQLSAGESNTPMPTKNFLTTTILGGSKQTPTRAPDWMWGAAFGAATGWYLNQTKYGMFVGFLLGAVVFDYFAVEAPRLILSKKAGHSSLSS